MALETEILEDRIGKERAVANLNEEATLFPYKTFLRCHLSYKDRVINDSLGNLFLDLVEGKFWGVLSRLDGTEDKRFWAKNQFTESELDKLFWLSVNMGITPIKDPKLAGAPGYSRGHAILYQQLVETPGSMFAEKLTPNFRKRLNNGSFWEELPNADKFYKDGRYGSRTINDIFENHSEDLDPNFARAGYKLFDRNDEVFPGNRFEFGYLSKKAIGGYAEFVTRLDLDRDQSGLESDQIARLVRPLAVDAIETTGEEGWDAKYPLKSRSSYVRRLKSPPIVEYVKSSDLVRSALADRLKLMTLYGNTEHAMAVLKVLPNPNDIFTRMADNNLKPLNELAELMRKFESAGILVTPKPNFSLQFA